MKLDLPEWAPDNASPNSGLSALIKNAVPQQTGYGPLPGLAQYNVSALAARAYGLGIGRTNSNSFAAFAGTTTKLYKLSGSSWTDVSRLVGGNYGVPTTDLWRFAQFGTYLYATNVNDTLQRIDINSGTNFAAVAGSPPQARNVTVVGDFLVLSSLNSDGQAIRWSAINDPTSWTLSVNLADTQTFPDGGRVTGVAGGQVGYVLQEYAINRMTFQPGSDYVFTFEKIINGKGCISPYGYETVAGTVFFVAEDGFYAYSASNGLLPIGSQRVNDWFQSNTDRSRVQQVLCIADPYRPRIYWAAYSSGNSSNYDLLMIYDWSLNRWTYSDMSAQIWAPVATPGTGLDSLPAVSIDTMTVSFDDRRYDGGRPALAAIDGSGVLSFQSGPNLTAQLETQELNPMPGGRALVRFATPATDNLSVTVAAATRNRFEDALSWGSEKSIEITGKALMRAEGRFHKYRLTMPAGSSWTTADAVDIDPVGTGIGR